MHLCSGAFADPACNEHQPVDAYLPELVGQQFISACWITGSKSLLCFVIAHKSFNKGALCTAVGTSSNVRHQALRTPWPTRNMSVQTITACFVASHEHV
jgi:hypothetical protein